MASVSPLVSSFPGVVDFSVGEINPLFAASREVLIQLNRGFNLPYPGYVLPVLLWFSPTWRAQHKVLQEYLSKSVADARKRQEMIGEGKGSLASDAECMIDMFLQQESSEGTGGFEPNELLDELLALFV